MATVTLDRRTSLDEARRLEQKDLSAAIEAYRRLVALNPKDWTSANALGDALIKGKMVDEAVDEYMRLGERLAEEGHIARAVAVYKKVFRLRPAHLDVADRIDALGQRRLQKAEDGGLLKRVLEAAQAESAARDARPAEPVAVVPALAAPPVAAPNPVEAATLQAVEWLGPAEPSSSDAVEVDLSGWLEVPVPSSSPVPDPSSVTEPAIAAPSPHQAPAAQPSPTVVDGSALDAARVASAEPAVDDALAAAFADMRVMLMQHLATTTKFEVADLGIAEPFHIGAVALADRIAPEVPWDEADVKPTPDLTFHAWRERWIDGVATSAELSLERGMQLAEEGAWERAAALFAEAALAPHLRHESSRCLAQACLTMGAPAQAVAWLDWAAQVPANSPATARALAYDVGVSLEAAGQRQLALAVLTELREDAGARYLDIDARIARLSSEAIAI